MKEEPKSEAQYTGRVLPGSRWRQRAFSKHIEQEVTVLRVGARSVMLVIEGGSLAGHDRRKVGQKFNVVLETFLKTHTLLSQPKGYKPGDEVVAPVAPSEPQKDAVETYFKRRQFAQDWIASMEGRDVRGAATDPDFPLLPAPVYTGDVFRPTPQEEEPVQNAQAEPEQPQQEQGHEPVEPDAATVAAEMRETLDNLAVEVPEPAPAPPVDPLDALVDNARAIVAGLDTEIAGKKWTRDELAEKVAKLDAEIATLSTRRTRATHAVDALVATLLGINEPEPEPEPITQEMRDAVEKLAASITIPKPASEPTAQTEAAEIVERPSYNGTVRLAGRDGYVPRPGKLSQRQWVLDRFVREGKLVIQEVVDEFAAEYEITRDAAIKNISSVMHSQMKHPNQQWPVPVRTYQGSYALPEPAQQI